MNRQPAEKQHTWLCRVVEGLDPSVLKPVLDGDFQITPDIINDYDLYLWSPDKAEACLEYWRNRPYSVPDGLNLGDVVANTEGVIHTDHMSSVVFIDNHWEPTFQLAVFRCLIVAYNEGFHEGQPVAGLCIFNGCVSVTPDVASQRGWHAKVLDRSAFSAFGEVDGELRRIPLSEELTRATSRDVASALVSALEQVAYVLKPREVVIRECPAKQRKPGKGRALRAQDRAVHILLDPDAVRILKRSVSDSNGTHASPMPHKRRAHVRVLRSPRFKDARNKVVSVGESFVNYKEGESYQVKRRIYHVVTLPTLEGAAHV